VVPLQKTDGCSTPFYNFMDNHIYQGAVETVGCQLLVTKKNVDEDNFRILIFYTIIQEYEMLWT
jgi:hypothetical protein